jgi:hypothetical protein
MVWHSAGYFHDAQRNSVLNHPIDGELVKNMDDIALVEAAARQVVADEKKGPIN